MEYKNSKGQTIGTLKEGIFRKVVNKSKHLMLKMDSWGIQYDVVLAIKDTCTEIRIKETREDVVYVIPFKKFFEESVVMDFGDGRQAFCERSKFIVRGRKDEVEKPLNIRNNKESLIALIVAKTDEPDKRALATRIAIAYNTMKWSETDLHALLKKADDPKVYNYSSFVKWSCTMKGCEPSLSPQNLSQ